MPRPILLAGLIAFVIGCEQSVDPNPPPPEPAAVTAHPIQLPPGDPRNAVLQTAKYPNHGEERALGMAKIGGARVEVKQFGPIMAGGEAHFVIDPGGTAVAGVYVWIGHEDDGKKRRWPAAPEPEGYHVHCAVPRPLEDDHVLWIEVKLPSGKRHRGNLTLGTE